MAKTYQVVGEMAHVDTTDPVTGVRSMVAAYKGATVPADCSEDRIKHLLSVRLIAEPEEVPLAPNSPLNPDLPGGSAPAPAGGDAGEGGPEAPTPTPETDPDVEARRAAAREKLAGINGVPNGRHGEDVLIEYLSTQGYEYAELTKVADKAELVEMVKRASQS